MYDVFILAVVMAVLLGGLVGITCIYALLLKLFNPEVSFKEIWKSL